MKFPTRWVLLLLFFSLTAGCGNAAAPGGATLESAPSALTVLTVSDIQAEMNRIADLNQTRDFSTPVRPFEETAIGVDGRNGRVLALKYICWDICPDIGAYFLVYPDVPAETDCQAVSGRALFAPTPVPGPYMGCRAVVE